MRGVKTMKGAYFAEVHKVEIRDDLPKPVQSVIGNLDNVGDGLAGADDAGGLGSVEALAYGQLHGHLLHAPADPIAHLVRQPDLLHLPDPRRAAGRQRHAADEGPISRAARLNREGGMTALSRDRMQELHLRARPEIVAGIEAEPAVRVEDSLRQATGSSGCEQRA